MMGFSVHDSSMERDHDDSDVSAMIKQICAKSDIIFPVCLPSFWYEEQSK